MSENDNQCIDQWHLLLVNVLTNDKYRHILLRCLRLKINVLTNDINCYVIVWYITQWHAVSIYRFFTVLFVLFYRDHYVVAVVVVIIIVGVRNGFSNLIFLWTLYQFQSLVKFIAIGQYEVMWYTHVGWHLVFWWIETF